MRDLRNKPAHLTVNGWPLCTCGSLMYQHDVTCGYMSIAAARRAKLELQKHVSGVKVVRGYCPTLVTVVKTA